MDESSSVLFFLDRAQGASGCGRFPRRANKGVWRKNSAAGSARARRYKQFYPNGEAPSERKRRPSRRTTATHTKGWARALSEAGIPICWVCNTRNHRQARACMRCGQRLVNRPSSSSSVVDVPAFKVESEWSAIHSVCVALSVVIAVGFLVLG